MTTTYITPTMGASGSWTLISPYDGILTSGITYTCEAIRMLTDLVEKNESPYSTYYSPYSVSEAKYDEDLANSVSIVSLRGSDGNWAYVPTSYIKSYPNMDGVSYANMAFMVELGPLPSTVSLTYAASQISDVVTNTLGVTATVTSLATSGTTIVSSTDSTNAETARKAKVTSNSTDYAQLQTANATIASLQKQITALNTYIASLSTSSTTTTG